MSGALYIVATPIGNLSDISDRALITLKSVDLILTEDTRVTRNLLKHFDIQVDVLSYHHHSGSTKREMILKRLRVVESIALVSDAGTPGISDPGNELIDYLLENDPNIKVVPIPGPSAVTAALSVCGFNVSKYLFIGFFPKKKKQKLVNQISGMDVPVIFYESPHRIIKTLELLRENLGDRRVFVGRELTKLHETLYRGTFEDVINELSKGKVKGELVVVIE